MFLCPKKLLMGLLFMLLASSVAFQAVRSVLGGWIASAEGLPKIGGLFVHALVFLVLSTMIWRMPFGSSNFEGMDDEEFVRRKMFAKSHKSGGFFKAAKRAVKEAEGYESDDAEEYMTLEGAELYESDDGEDFRLSKSERRARREARRASRRAARAARAAEEYNQPDPSKMHAGVYH